MFLKSLKSFFHTLWRNDLNFGPAWLSVQPKHKEISPPKGSKEKFKDLKEGLAILVKDYNKQFFLSKTYSTKPCT